MIISMRPHATREEIRHVCERIEEFGYKVHSIEGEERVVIGVVGVGDVTACLESLEATPGVERAVRISAPYKFVSREFKPDHTILRVNGVEIGGDEFVVMAGPCSVESERQIMETAEGRGRGRRAHAARWRFQAAHVALRFPGHGTGRPEAAAQGEAGHRTRDRHRSDERSRRGHGRRVRRRHAGGRAQHAELRSIEIAGRLRAPRAAEAGHELDHQGTADVRRVRGGARQS